MCELILEGITRCIIYSLRYHWKLTTQMAIKTSRKRTFYYLWEEKRFYNWENCLTRCLKSSLAMFPSSRCVIWLYDTLYMDLSWILSCCCNPIGCIYSDPVTNLLLLFLRFSKYYSISFYQRKWSPPYVTRVKTVYVKL